MTDPQPGHSRSRDKADPQGTPPKKDFADTWIDAIEKMASRSSASGTPQPKDRQDFNDLKAIEDYIYSSMNHTKEWEKAEQAYQNILSRCASHHLARQNDPAAIAAAARADERGRVLDLLIHEYDSGDHPEISDCQTTDEWYGHGWDDCRDAFVQHMKALRSQQPGGEDGGAGNG